MKPSSLLLHILFNQYAQVGTDITTDKYCIEHHQYCSELTLLVQTKYDETLTRLNDELSKLDEARLQQLKFAVR